MFCISILQITRTIVAILRLEGHLAAEQRGQPQSDGAAENDKEEPTAAKRAGVAQFGARLVQRGKAAHVVPHGSAGPILHRPGVVREWSVFRAQHAESLDLQHAQNFSNDTQQRLRLRQWLKIIIMVGGRGGERTAGVLKFRRCSKHTKVKQVLLA